MTDDFSDEPVEMVQLDLNKVRENLPQFSSQKLCEMIVCDRYFGFGQEISVICMEELAKRRTAGDTFAFETYIEQVYKGLPVLDFTMPDIRSIMQQAINIGRRR
jgi:hypothetical protein